MTSRNASRTSLISQYELIPTPSHRHASPSAPWPWMDIGDEVDSEQLNTELPPVPLPCDHSSCEDDCWTGYPQSRFPNWTPQQVERSGIADIIDAALDEAASKIYHVDIQDDGFFVRGMENLKEAMYSDRELWEKILELEPPEGTRLRALFVEEMSSRVLRMLGAKYNIEPFFFSSSINWIPSLYQENPRPGKGDHITVTMTFLRCRTIQDDAAWAHVLHLVQSLGSSTDSLSQQVINTKAPLPLRESKRVLMLDLLSVHLIRSQSGSIMISYHPKRGQYSTSAAYLRDRLQFAGRSVYWQHIFRDYEDPTFVLLVVLWHAVYAWDEALEALYQHICHMEGSAIKASDMGLTQQLHIVRAHLLHYSSLLDDFKKTIEFVHQTPHLVKDERIGPRVEGYLSPDEVMDRECKKLLKEIGRLKDGIGMQDQRSKNVINLVYSRVNIQDSHLMMEMTQAAVRDSAAMKQIAYLTMIFLPSSFVAAIFGMNVQEIVPDSGETLARFFAVALPLTFLTVWIIVALQSQYLYGRDRVSLLTRLAWPAYLAKVFWDRKFNPNGRGPGRDGMGGYDPDEDENVGIYGTRMMLEEKTKWTPRLRHPNNAPRPSGELYTRTRAPGNV